VVDLSTDSRGMFYDRVRGNRGSYRVRSLSASKATSPSRTFKTR
jgi:hypothetical protein